MPPSGAVEGGVAEAEDAAVGGDHPVAVPVGRRGDADDGPVQPQRARRAVEVGVAETEDAAVGRHQPVAAAVGRRRHADDGCVERAAERAVVLGGPEVPDLAVGLDLPVAGAVRERGHPDDARGGHQVGHLTPVSQSRRTGAPHELTTSAAIEAPVGPHPWRAPAGPRGSWRTRAG